MATDEKTEHTPARYVRRFCEAQSRASNIVHDLDDLEWIDADDAAVHATLQGICEEAVQLVSVLLMLSGSSSVLVCPPGMKLKLQPDNEGTKS